MKDFQRFGLMVDMSRNAVMNPAALKEFITLTADMGYNALLLYTEDTYEIPGEPYFGHFRGRYSVEELKEIVSFGGEQGMEVIPCIQTLAHLDNIFRWPRFQKIRDRDNILLAEEEETYRFIDTMLRSIRAWYPGKVIHIGMDEAHALGLGNYLDRNGFQNRFQIFTRHLKRVCALAEQYGFEPVIWSDMFFRLANHGVYATDTPAIPLEEIGELPEGVALTYWEYYTTREKRYRAMIDAHKALKRPLWFAGGIWTWKGFAPDNAFSIRATRAALDVCRQEGIQNVFLTLWGDNGGECSRFSVLPALYAGACFARGEMDEAQIKEDFAAKYGVPFDAFCLLDMHEPQNGATAAEAVTNPEKYLLFNDPFLGVCDSTLTGKESDFYQSLARDLAKWKKAPRYGYLFESLSHLSAVLAIKADLGVRTRTAYQAGDRAALSALVQDYRACRRALARFIRAFREQWLKENNPQGLEIQEIRLGGLMERLSSCEKRLEAFLKDGTPIPELDEAPLDLQGGGDVMAHKPLRLLRWGKAASANTIGEQ